MQLVALAISPHWRGIYRIKISVQSAGTSLDSPYLVHDQYCLLQPYGDQNKIINSQKSDMLPT